MNERVRRLGRTWLLTAVIDGLFSSVLAQFFYGSTAVRLFQGVASTLLGPSTVGGGARPFWIGLAMHFGVALTWSTVFFLLAESSAWLRRVIDTPGGVVAVAAVYGPCVWLVMSLLVIPALTHRPTSFTVRWWIQLVGHFPFVGLPIVASIARRRPAA